jgi:hypothetical protein
MNSNTGKKNKDFSKNFGMTGKKRLRDESDESGELIFYDV